MAVTFDPTEDFADIVDGSEAVTLKPRGSADTTSIETALKRLVSHSEIEASNGKYLAGDTRWHLPQEECSTRPGLGDTLEDSDGTDWIVLAVKDATLGARWVCTCRDMVESFGLHDLITIEKATATKGDAGAVERSWATWKQIHGKVQLVDVDVGQEDGARVAKRTHNVFLAQDVEIGPQHRLKDQRDNYYRVLGYSKADEIGLLETVEVEAW